MAVIDCITYNGESDLFELRYQILKDVVDEFNVVEFDETFSGKKKPFLFPQIKNRYPKVKYHKSYKTLYGKYRDLAKSSPNTIGADHWKREFMQKESIKDFLVLLKDEDLVFIGDCDEIWNPESIDYIKIFNNPYKLKLEVYTYYLNNYSTEQFCGTLVSRYKYIKDKCLNELRTTSRRTLAAHGWHFTSLRDSLKQKLEDSYTEETYANPIVMMNLEENIKNNRDFLGRDFKYRLDESSWPAYLKQNRSRYNHLIKEQ